MGISSSAELKGARDAGKKVDTPSTSPRGTVLAPFGGEEGRVGGGRLFRIVVFGRNL